MCATPSDFGIARVQKSTSRGNSYFKILEMLRLGKTFWTRTLPRNANCFGRARAQELILWKNSSLGETSSGFSSSYVLDKLLDAHSSAQRPMFWNRTRPRVDLVQKSTLSRKPVFSILKRTVPWINFWTRALQRNA